MAEFPSVFDLSALDGANGFRIDGIDADDYSGMSVASAGDVNGDGYDDIIVGADSADPNGDRAAGKSYVVFGSGAGFAAAVDLAALNGNNGFRIEGIDASDFSGYSVASAGDVNGDGYDDIIVSAPFADPNGDINAGESYVVFGSGAGFAASLDLAALDGSNGFRIDGIDNLENSGRSVASAGDVNGDGFDDIIVGAHYADPDGDSGAGESYVVFGSGSGFVATVDLAALDGTNGFRIDGIDTEDHSGRSVASAGDVNGDGYDDIIVGASGAHPDGDSDAGESYVVFGSDADFAASLDLAALDGTNGFRIDGIDAEDQSGRSVASAGDVNGDGYDDIIVGAPFANPNGDSSAGESYVVFGSGTGFAASLDLATLDGANGFRIDSRDYSGWSVGSAGDVNGDGYDDIIVSAPFADPNGDINAGESYVVFGSGAGFAASLDLAALDGTNGFRIGGIDGSDQSGRSVASAGDVNDDGFDDIIVGAPFADPNGDSSAGESYVVFGREPDSAVTRVGAAGDQTIRGGDFADRLAGLGGNDVLDGGNGHDRLNGGVGIDTASYRLAAAGVVLKLTATGGQNTRGAGRDTLTSIEGLEGSAFGDTLLGAANVNRLDGGGGNDRLYGLGGNDSVDGGAGNDFLEGGTGADTMTGGLGNDRVDGGAGNDFIEGGTGADIMTGGLGNDIYFVDSARDVTVESVDAGVDEVRATANHSLAANIEVLRLVGVARIGNGNALDNAVTGSGGNDRLRGLGGADDVRGGNGNDRVYGGVGDDGLFGGAGDDLVYGEDGDDRLFGESALDSLFGGGGNDRLDGGDAADMLNGGAGGDVLIGGAGRDTLTGGAGADQFVFDDGDSSALQGQADRIVSFSSSQGDRINLRQIDADEGAAGDQNFAFVGTAAFSGEAGELRYQVVSGGVLVSGDTDGDAVADFFIRVDGPQVVDAADYVI